jgi:hypothetical protein
VPLEAEDHGDGVVHRAADVEGVHLAVLPADDDDDENDGAGAGVVRDPDGRAVEVNQAGRCG